MSKRSASILVVDDEQEIVRALQRGLVAHGYTVRTAHSGEEALEAVANWRPDLLVLDLLLPGMSGLEVCRRVRATSNVPIIVLSIKDAEADKVEALDLGADDYIAKPFGMSELLARVRAALRRIARAKSGTEPRVQVGPLSVDFAQRRVVLRGREVSLTPIEYELLKVFHHTPRQDSHAADAALRRSGEPVRMPARTACTSTWPSCATKSNLTPSSHV